MPLRTGTRTREEEALSVGVPGRVAEKEALAPPAPKPKVSKRDLHCERARERSRLFIGMGTKPQRGP